MSRIEELRTAIQAIAEQSVGNTNDLVFEAEVAEVQDETITILTEGMRLTDVRTCAMTDGDDANLRIYPAVGSTVVCLDASAGARRDVVVLQYSAIRKITVNGGEQSVPNGTELKSQLEVMSQRIDALYDAIRNSPTGKQDGGELYKQSMVTSLADVKKERFDEIEDKTLLH